MSERNEIFREIQTILAGHTERETLAALVGCLVVAIGVASDSMDHATATIDALPADMKNALRIEWAKLRKHRNRVTIRHAIEAGEPVH